MSGKRNRIWTYVGALLLMGAVLLPAAARADIGPFWRESGEKPGPWMFNLKTGGAFTFFAGNDYGYAYGLPNMFVLQMEGGYALDRKRNAYLLFSPTFELTGGLSAVLLPFGFQYDIPMPFLKGFYLVPRASAGFGVLVHHGYYYYGGYQAATYLTGFFAPEFGAKYVLKGRMNFGLDLFSLPIFIGSQGVLVQYRAFLYAGINI